MPSLHSEEKSVAIPLGCPLPSSALLSSFVVKVEKLTEGQPSRSCPPLVPPLFAIPSAVEGQCPSIIRISKIIDKPISKYERKLCMSSKKTSAPTSYNLNDPAAKAVLDDDISRLVDAITVQACKREPLENKDPNSMTLEKTPFSTKKSD